MTRTADAAEQQAIKQLKAGDINGLEVLVKQYQVKAVRTAYLITHDRALAEDVVQATFIRIYEQFKWFDDSRPFAPWFYRSVANAAIQTMRRESRYLSLNTEVEDDGIDFLDILADSGPGPDEMATAADLRRRVRDALEKLSPQQRAVVVLRYYADLSEQEMAAELEVPPGTIKWRLHAARKQLRLFLAPLVGNSMNPER